MMHKVTSSGVTETTKFTLDLQCNDNTASIATIDCGKLLLCMLKIIRFENMCCYITKLNYTSISKKHLSNLKYQLLFAIKET